MRMDLGVDMRSRARDRRTCPALYISHMPRARSASGVLVSGLKNQARGLQAWLQATR
jgi:hypothetical protein